MFNVVITNIGNILTISYEDLLAFDNVGIVSYNESHILYKSTVRFGFEVTAHTYVGFRDVYPNINLNEKHSERFFTIYSYYFGTRIDSAYDVSWSTINYGDIERYHEYDGVLPITVGIKDITPPSGVINLKCSFLLPMVLDFIEK